MTKQHAEREIDSHADTHTLTVEPCDKNRAKETACRRIFNSERFEARLNVARPGRGRVLLVLGVEEKEGSFAFAPWGEVVERLSEHLR